MTVPPATESSAHCLNIFLQFMTAEVDFGEVNSSDRIRPTLLGRITLGVTELNEGGSVLDATLLEFRRAGEGTSISLQLEACIGILKGER